MPEDALKTPQSIADEPLPPSRDTDRDRLERYSMRAEPAMLALAIASVPLFLLEDRFWLASAAGWVVVAIFLVDLVVRVVLTDEPRSRSLARHWYDVAIVVLSLLSVAHPLRALRAVRLLRGLRVFVAAHKVAVSVSRGWQGAARQVADRVERRFVGCGVGDGARGGKRCR